MTAPPPAPDNRLLRHLRESHPYLFWPALPYTLLCLAAFLLILPFARDVLNRDAIALEHMYYQMDPEEGALLFQAQELKEGRPIYRPLTDYPYVAGTYPPVYLLASALMPGEYRDSFRPGRTVSFFALGLTLFAIFCIPTIRKPRNEAAALAAVALFGITYEVFRWMPYYRVDFLALMFSMLGLLCVVISRTNWYVLAASILFFALAFFTKQTELTAAAACVCAVAFTSWRRGLWYAAGLCAAIAVPFAILTLATHGQFAIHTIYYNMNRYIWGDLARWSAHAWRFHRWLTVAGLLSFAATAYVRRFYVLRDPVALFIPFSILNFLAIGKSGSAENYLLTPLAAFALGSCALGAQLTGAVIRNPQSAIRNVPVARVFGLFVGVLVLFHAFHVRSLAPLMFSPGASPNERDFAAASEVMKAVTKSPSSWTEHGVFNLLAGRSIDFQPFIINELVQQRRIPRPKFYDDVAGGKYALLVTWNDLFSEDYNNVYSPELRDIIRTAYRERQRITYGNYWRYYLYEPRTSTDAQTSSPH